MCHLSKSVVIDMPRPERRIRRTAAGWLKRRSPQEPPEVMCRMPTPNETRGRTLAEDLSISLQLVGLVVKVKITEGFAG